MQYEVLTVIPGSFSKEKAEKTISRLKGVISSFGSISKEIIWLRRPLAYAMGKEISGTYFICLLEAEPKNIQPLSDTFRLDGEVMRDLIVKTPKGYELQDYTEEQLNHDFAAIKREVFSEKEAAKKDEPKKERSSKKTTKKPANTESN